MTENIIKSVPEFTSDETPGGSAGIKEVKEAELEKVQEEEKETPTEPPADIKPGGEPVGDTGELMKQIQGLQGEKEKLLQEIQGLRGSRRELKQEQINKVEEKLDDLKDLHPDDIAVIEKVIRAKGYVTKEDVEKKIYEDIKQDELNKFLSKYPEYKPENDKNDINWNALQRELGYYRLPKDPHQLSEILERAHRSISKTSSDHSIIEKKQKLETAGVGVGGAQRSSSKKTLEPHKREELRRGGWSEEEILKIEQNLG